MRIPCIYDSGEDCFKASVEVAEESKFHFVCEDSSQRRLIFVSNFYSTEVQFDGSVVNVLK